MSNEVKPNPFNKAGQTLFSDMLRSHQAQIEGNPFFVPMADIMIDDLGRRFQEGQFSADEYNQLLIYLYGDNL